MREKTCKYCKEKFTPEQPLQYLCKPPKDCSWKYIQAQALKKREKDNREWKKTEKQKLMTLADYKWLFQVHINLIARLIDYKQGCIATDIKTGKMNGGHYIAVGSNESIRFNLHNIHIQSFESNHFKSGDTIKYQDGLKRVYGSDYFEFVESLRQTQPIKLTIETLKEKISIAKLIVKELKELGNTYTAKERLDLRNEYNSRLGIYFESYVYPF